MELQVEKINLLADIIENCKEVLLQDHEPGNDRRSFSMESAWYECGAPACLLGHNHAMHGRTRRSIKRVSHQNNLDAIAYDLGLTYSQAAELCVPTHNYAQYTAAPGDPGFITTEHAAAVLRNLADEGRVEWDIFGAA